MRLKTARLILRPAVPEDAAAYAALRSAPFVLRWNAMEALDEEGARRELARAAQTDGRFMIELPRTGLIGEIAAEEDALRWGVGARTLSCFLGEAHARRGYMTEAMRAVIGALFAREEVGVLSARTFADNRASQRMLEKLGFVREGLLRRCVRGWGGVVHDDVLWSLLREEWQNQKEQGTGR